MSWMLLGFMWAYTIYKFFSLPAIIPTHYNFKNQVDGYGSKYVILTLPVISSFLFGLLSLINKYPQSFNYSVKITEQNALRQYTMATRLLRGLKCLLLLLFTSFVFETGLKDPFPWWVATCFLLIVLLPIVFYIVKSVRER